MLSKHRFVTTEETETILFYDNGLYRTGGEILIAKELESKYGYELNTHNLSQIIGHIKRRTYHKLEEFDTDINIINMKNGLYDIHKNELLPHTSDYLSMKQLSFNHDKDLRPKEFGKFLSEILYSSDIRTVIELFGYTFHRDNPFEIITTLLGGGANGKNVLLGILSKLHGIGNVSNVSMKSIIENRFALAGLEGKNVNIDTELSSVTIKDTALLKKITGRQPINIERKNKDPYEATLYAKLFFNANQPPPSNDDSDAYFRRNIQIHLPNQFEEVKSDINTKIADPYILAKLTTEEELSGIFNLLMRYLRILLKNKRVYVNEQTIQERRERYQLALVPTEGFLKEAMSEDSIESDWETKEHLYQAYRRFCKKKRMMTLSKEKFGSEMKNRHNLQSARLTTGKRETIWKGIKLTPEYLLELSQTTIIK